MPKDYRELAWEEELYQMNRRRMASCENCDNYYPVPYYDQLDGDEREGFCTELLEYVHPNTAKEDVC